MSICRVFGTYLLLLAVSAYADTAETIETINGVLHQVHSPLVFELDVRGVKHRVRLKNIKLIRTDSVSMERARIHLTRLLQDREITVWYRSRDAAGTKIGIVSTPTAYVNFQMVRDGMAVPSEITARAQIQDLYAMALAAAKEANLGLWGVEEASSMRDSKSTGEESDFFEALETLYDKPVKR